MGKKRTPGLYKRRGKWHIDKHVHGKRIYANTGYDRLEDAENFLAREVEKLREAKLFGVRPQRIFRDAANKYLLENRHKASIADAAMHLQQLNPYIGNLPLENVHNSTLQTFINARLKTGIKTKSVNLALGVVRLILNLAATEWIDEFGLTWLAHAPKIRLLKVIDSRNPYPISWDEQIRLFNELPDHLRLMATFKVNTGTREQEVCRLKWEWEVKIPELDTSIFLVPRALVKNREDRLIVLNRIAKNVIEQVRGQNHDYVFTYRGNPVTCMNNSAWQRARKKVNLNQVRIHDLKHTFGRRLRAAGVSFEDRQDLLGHRSGRITTHYSAAELSNLLDAANKVCDGRYQTPTLTLLRSSSSHQSPTKLIMPA